MGTQGNDAIIVVLAYCWNIQVDITAGIKSDDENSFVVYYIVLSSVFNLQSIKNTKYANNHVPIVNYGTPPYELVSRIYINGKFWK